MNILVVINKPSARFKGLIGRYLFKIDTGLYAGRIPRNIFCEFEGAAEGQDAIICEFNSKNSFGVNIIAYGSKKDEFELLDGVLLPYTNGRFL